MGILLWWSWQSLITHNCGFFHHSASLDQGRTLRQCSLLIVCPRGVYLWWTTTSWSKNTVNMVFIVLWLCRAFYGHGDPGDSGCIIPNSLLNHWNSLHWGMFKLNAKFNVDSLLYCSVILNVTATQYTCSLNGIYHLHWLVQWSPQCSHMCIPSHSPWLPGYIDVMQTILVILIITGLFLDRPCIIYTKYQYLYMVNVTPSMLTNF